MNANLKLESQCAPFKIPDELRMILKEYPVEMGTPPEIGQLLPAKYFWVAENGENEVCGYVWVNEKENNNHSLNLAVPTGMQKQGVGKFLLESAEKELTVIGITEIHAQVNSNQPDSGLIIRKMLMRNKWSLIRDNISKRRTHLSDEQLIEADPCTLYFVKYLK